MDHRAEVAEFLRTRRDRLTPEQAGIIGGGRRRVPGLRREELAMLAGVSVEYYARMERGNLSGVSREVREALARALQLDEAESDHLANLARAAEPASSRRRQRPPEPDISPSLIRFINAVTDAPIWVRDRRLSHVASNALGRALYASMLDDPANQENMARFTFLNPASQNFFPEWEKEANGIVSTLHSYAGQNPLDKQLTNLIGELVTRSDVFRHRWAMHSVRHHRSGLKRINHPVVGELELAYDALDLPANPDCHMFVLTAAGSDSEERLKLLGSHCATPCDTGGGLTARRV